MKDRWTQNIEKNTIKCNVMKMLEWKKGEHPEYKQQSIALLLKFNAIPRQVINCKIIILYIKWYKR